MMPFLQIKGSPDRSTLLSCVTMDYAKRLLHRLLAYEMPDSAGTSSADQSITQFCRAETAEEIVRRLVNSDFEGMDIMSEDSDQEDERSFWESHMAYQQEQLIR